jgi:hypothetical protein
MRQALVALLAASLLFAAEGCKKKDAAAEDIAAVDSSPKTYCDEVGQVLPRDSCSDLEAAAKDAQAGVAAFAAPQSMKRGQQVTLKLVVGYAPPPRSAPTPPTSQATETTRTIRLEKLPNGPARHIHLGSGAASRAPSPSTASLPPSAPASTPSPVDEAQGMGEPVSQFGAPVGPRMEAELIAPSFDVKPLTRPWQNLEPGGTAMWMWQVTARGEGPQSLTVKTTVQSVVDNVSYDLKSTSHSYSVTVAVGFWGKVWDWIVKLPDEIKVLTGVLAALTALVGAWFGLRLAIKKGEAQLAEADAPKPRRAGRRK